jgi:hypothetical protein
MVKVTRKFVGSWLVRTRHAISKNSRCISEVRLFYISFDAAWKVTWKSDYNGFIAAI